MKTTDANEGGRPEVPDGAGDLAEGRRVLLTDPLPPLPPDRASSRLLRLACRLGDAQIVGAGLHAPDGSRQWWYEPAPSPAVRTALEQILRRASSDTALPVESPGDIEDPELREAVSQAGIHSFITVPVRSADGPCATLVAASNHSRPWRQDQLEGLEEIAAALGETWLLRERSVRVRTTGANLYDLLDRATDMVVALAPDGTIFYANGALNAGLGYTAEEIVGRRAAEFVAPERLDEFKEAADRMLRKGELREFETALLKRGGSRMLVTGSGNCRYEGGTPVAMRLFFRDVTEERAVEAEVELIERIAHEIGAGETLAEGLQRSMALLGEFDAWRCAEAWVHDEDHGDIRRIATWCAPDADARYPADEMERCVRQAIDDGRVVESPTTGVYAVPLKVMDSVRGVVVVEATSGASSSGGAPLLMTTLVHIAPTIERRRAEQALIESRARLADFLDRVGDLVVSLTPGGKIRYANRAWRQALGYGDVDPTGASIADVIPEGTRELARRELERLTPGGRGARFETELLARDGRVVEVVGRVRARRDHDGQVALEGIFTNESARKHAERELRETEQRLRSILRTMREGILLLDRDGRPLFGNPAAADILRLSRRSADTYYDAPDWKIEGRDPMDYMRSDFALGRVLESGQPVSGIERALEHPDGTRTIISFNASPQLDEAGEVRAVVVSFRDVTERKAVEEQLRERERQLSEAQAMAEIGSWEWDLDSGEVRWSDELLRIFGHSGEGELDLASMLQAIAEQDREAVHAVMERLRQEPGSFAIEYGWVAPGGENRTLLARGELVQDEDGRPTRLLGVTQDVTKRRQQEAELRRARDDAQAAARAKSEFLANMSHEIRTPLAGIAGMTDLLLGTDLSTRQREYLDMIRTSGESLVRIIDDILDVSRVEAGKLSLHNHTFDLHEELEATVRRLSVQAEQKGLRLGLQISDDVPAQFHSDAGRLSQILNNLIGNAIKFTDAGEVTLTARLERSGPGEPRLHLAVRDTGIGIPAAKMRTIFEPFAQADSSTSRRFGGTGLGLSISAQLAGLMGGTIDVESVEGAGSTFHLRLPIQPAFGPEVSETSATSAASGETNGRSGDAGGERRGLRVLVAEDNPVNQHFMQAVLTGAGHAVELVADGRAAVERALSREFDLVLMDVQMPEMGGIDATQRIRREEPHRSHLPIVAVTAHALKAELDRCTAAGMDDYLTKPFSGAQLLEKIRTVTEAARAVDHTPPASQPHDKGPRGMAELISRLGDAATLQAVGPVLLGHTPANLVRLEKAIAAQDSAAGGIAHTLRGSISLFGADELTAALRQLETTVKDGRWQDAARGVDEIREPLERLLDLVRRSLEHLGSRKG